VWQSCHLLPDSSGLPTSGGNPIRAGKRLWTLEPRDSKSGDQSCLAVIRPEPALLDPLPGPYPHLSAKSPAADTAALVRRTVEPPGDCQRSIGFSCRSASRPENSLSFWKIQSWLPDDLTYVSSKKIRKRPGEARRAGDPTGRSGPASSR